MEDFPQSRDVDNQELQAGGERASSEDLARKEVVVVVVVGDVGLFRIDVYIFETPHFEMGCLKIINVLLTFPERNTSRYLLDRAPPQPLIIVTHSQCRR